MMTKSRLVLGAIFIAVSFGVSTAHADAASVDPFNCYQWNRANAEARNGSVDRGDWYEWWYYKAVLPDTHEAVLFTYGVVNPWDSSGTRASSHAFVSFGELNSGIFVENRAPVSDFEAHYDSPYVRVGDNVATNQEIRGNLTASDGHKVSWDITIERDWTFNAMSWATGIPGLSNIYWYPAQASATMTGWVDNGIRTIRLDHVPAYQDRNWGRSFPIWWTWLVSNHFEGNPGTVLASGGGRPSVLGKIPLFDAFTIGLRHQGKEYAFRVTDGDPIHANIRFGKWEVDGYNYSGDHIHISAFAPKEDFIDLPFQMPNGKYFHDFEALLGDIHVQLDHNGTPIADLVSHEAGIEYGSASLQPFGALFESETQLR